MRVVIQSVTVTSSAGSGRRVCRTSILPRWKWVDRFLPFWSDLALRDYYKMYKFVPDAELERKLSVCRKAIIKGHRVPDFTRKQAVLWSIRSSRGKVAQRRAILSELTGWRNLFADTIVILAFLCAW